MINSLALVARHMRLDAEAFIEFARANPKLGAFEDMDSGVLVVSNFHVDQLIEAFRREGLGQPISSPRP